MVSKPSQSQEGGDNSNNYQAGNDIHVHGMTLEQVRDVALDVFKVNALELQGIAHSVALARAETMTDAFLKRLEAEMPERLGKLADPDIQTVLFHAQREFSRSGEEELSDALVGLLMKRVGEDDRNTRTLALNEAIASAPKLTSQQRRVIAWIFKLRYTRMTNASIQGFYEELDRLVDAFGVDIPRSRSDFQHIEYVGVASSSILVSTFGSRLLAGNESLFTRGFLPTDLHDTGAFDAGQSAGLIVPALRNPERFQLRMLGHMDIEGRVLEAGLEKFLPSYEAASKIGMMTDEEVAREAVLRVPALRALRDAWSDEHLGMSSMTLTSVGIVLGHAYYVRGARDASPLSVWLP